MQRTHCRFATPPLHVRWKRPRQQGSSAQAASSLPVSEQAALDAASSPQASNMWLSGKTERDLFKSPDDQVGEWRYMSSLACVQQR